MTQIRASNNFVQWLDDYRKTNKLTREQALDNIRNRLDYLRYALRATQAAEIAPECKRRLFYDGKYWCVQTSRKGLNRLKEIPTLEICDICHLDKWKIPETAKINKPEATKEPETAKEKFPFYKGKPPLKRWTPRTGKIDMGDSEGVEPDYSEG